MRRVPPATSTVSRSATSTAPPTFRSTSSPATSTSFLSSRPTASEGVNRTWSLGAFLKRPSTIELLPEQARQTALQAFHDLVATPPEDVLVLHRRVVDVARLAGQLAQREHRLAGRLLEVREHATLLLRHDEDHVRLAKQVTIPLQVGRPGLGKLRDADLPQHELRVEGHQAAVAGIRCDAAGADGHAPVQAALAEEPQQHRLGDDAAARVRVTDDENPTRGGCGGYRAHLRDLRRRFRPCSRPWWCPSPARP